MGKPKLGGKHLCSNCETRFFDLGKNPPVCPKCATEAPVIKPKPKPKKSKAAEKAELAAKILAADAAAAAKEKEAEETKEKEEQIDGVEEGTDIDVDENDNDNDDDDELTEESQDNGLMEETSGIVGNEGDGISEVMDHVEPDKDAS